MENIPNISLLTEFDDLMRNEKVLTEGSEKEFLRFVKNTEFNRKRWETSEIEVQRLQIELSQAAHEISGLEAKLQQARTLFNDEHQARRRAEAERDKLSKQLQMLRQLILDGECVDEGTLRKVKNFESCITSVNEGNEESGYGNILSPGLMREAANCRRKSINMTDGSVLDVDDLSFDETVNLCESRTRAGTSFRKLNPEVREARKRSRSNSRRRSHGGVCEDVLENVGQERKRERRSRSVGISDRVEILEITPRLSPEKIMDQRLSVPEPASSTTSSSSTISSSATAAGHSSTKHEFEEKTELKSNKCWDCNKRIKFGKIYQKCRLCKITLHAECSSTSGCPGVMFPQSPGKVSSNPSVHLTRTPSKKEKGQMFASPMLQ